MKIISKALLLLCLLTLFISCSKKPTEAEPEPPVVNKPIVLSTATKEPEKLPNFSNVTVDSTKLVYQFSSSNIPTFKQGDILIGSTGEGYLRKVESVSKVGNTLSITTSNASLEDAFTKLEIDTSLIFYPSVEQIAPINHTSIVSNGDQKYNLSIECSNPLVVTKTISSDWTRSFPNMKYKLESSDKTSRLEVNIELVTVTFRIEAKDLKVKLFSGLNNNIKIVYHVTSETEFTNVSMVFKGGISGTIPENDDLLAKDISLGTYYIPGTIIPLHFSFNLGFGIDASFLVGYGANMYSSYKTTNNYDVGAEYIYGGWNGIWEKSSVYTSTVDFKPISNMEGDVKLYLKPKLKIKVADRIGPSLFVRGFFYANLVYPPIKAEVGVGLDGGLEFIIKAFKIDLLNFEWIIAEKKWPFWTYTNNEPIVPSIVSPTDNSTGVSISPTLNWSCSDPDGDALKYDVYIATFNPPLLPISSGQVESSLSQTGLAYNTKYYWTVKATDSRGAFTSGPIWSFTTESAKVVPSITTSAITNITSTTATVGGNVTGDGGGTVTERGVYWGTNPLVNGTKLQIGSNTGVFFTNLTGLTTNTNTTYYIKAYAINSQGAGYGDQVNFTTGVISVPVAAFTATPTTITAGQSVQFTDQSTNTPTSWSWAFGDGGTSTTRNPSHTYATAGTYTVSLTATNSFGSNTQTKTNYITVNSVSGGIIFNPDLTYGSVTDIDGNIYKTIIIGTQTWMAENLKTTKYRNGDPIPNVTDNTAWYALSTGSYCWYNNDAATYKATYGVLYNWGAVSDSRNIAPTGWHIPTDAEWTTLTTFLGGESVAGGKLKETGTTHWQSPNTGATNSSGFTALPGGCRVQIGTFDSVNGGGYWWSSTDNSITNAWNRSIFYGSVDRVSNYKHNGFSVRCLRDN